MAKINPKFQNFRQPAYFMLSSGRHSKFESNIHDRARDQQSSQFLWSHPARENVVCPALGQNYGAFEVFMDCFGKIRACLHGGGGP